LGLNLFQTLMENKNEGKGRISALIFGVILSFIVIEIAAQLYYFFVVKKQFDAVKNAPNFYLQKSANETLAYELKPNLNTKNNDKILITNELSLREKSNLIQKQKRTIGLLGDSVVFGTDQDQDSTLSARLQNDSLRVLNLGVPGYATHQIFEQFKIKHEKYQFDEVIYMLNPNDFTLRNTAYEGADNGVYRYFEVPFFKSIWFYRKLIYRIRKKGEVTFNIDFYKWCFDGTKEEIFEEIKRMKIFADAQKVQFQIVVLPAGSAYQNGNYELNEMYAEIENFLKTNSISYISPTNDYKTDTKSLIDFTDHLTPKGNELMIKRINETFDLKK
jgi:hypothetical protein